MWIIQGWAVNSTIGIYYWYLLVHVFTGLENTPKVANTCTGKYPSTELSHLEITTEILTKLTWNNI